MNYQFRMQHRNSLEKIVLYVFLATRRAIHPHNHFQRPSPLPAIDVRTPIRGHSLDEIINQGIVAEAVNSGDFLLVLFEIAILFPFICKLPGLDLAGQLGFMVGSILLYQNFKTAGCACDGTAGG